MSGNTTANTRAFIEAEQYSQFILSQLHDGMLPDSFYRDVSDFGMGETLNIKTVGAATIREVSEDTPMVYDPIDSGEVTLSITDYVGSGWHVSDKLRQDGSQIEALLAQQGQEVVRAIQERFETRFCEVANTAQTDADPNTINGIAHRIASAETNNVIALSHFIAQKLAFDKANVPAGGRIAIVDPVVEATLNGLVTATATVNNNPMFEGMINEGFAREHKFVKNIMGWDIYTSNRLDQGDFGDGTTTVTGGVANLFMSVLDDNTRPIMSAWRQQPSVEGERNKDLARDEFVERARWGLGAQRTDTLGVVITSATNY